ncbi:MAG: MFS transporter [Dehalococcoidia bacterium]|nr:MFS transporter [Dehalococcoidia bacterium]
MHERRTGYVIDRGWREAVSSLHNRDFRFFWLSSIFSFTGMQTGMVVRSWLVYDLTDSSTYLGLVSATSALPMIIFALPGGIIADRVAKRNLLIITQLATFAVAFALAVLIAGGWIDVWQIFVATFLAGAFFSLNVPGRMAMVAELVKPDQLMNAIAVNSAGSNATRMLAPAAAGLLVGAIGIGSTYFVYAFCYLLVVVTLLAIPNTANARIGKTTMYQDALEGLGYMRNNRVLMALLVFAVVPALFAMPYQMLMPVFARDVLKVGAAGLGMLLGIVGLGAVIGSAFVALLGGFKHRGLLSLLAGTAFGSTLILFGLSRDFYLSLAILILLGTASAVFNAINNTMILSIVPDELKGRVMGVFMASWGLMPLGTLPAGVLADIIGAPLTIVFAGSLTTLISLGGLLFVPSVRRLK